MTEQVRFYKARPKHLDHRTTAPVIAFVFGESGFYPIHTQATPEQLNDAGITAEILEAAEVGSCFGWDCAAAKAARTYAARKLAGGATSAKGGYIAVHDTTRPLSHPWIIEDATGKAIDPPDVAGMLNQQQRAIVALRLALSETVARLQSVDALLLAETGSAKDCEPGEVTRAHALLAQIDAGAV